MPFEMNWPCARCRKEVKVELKSVNEAVALEQHQVNIGNTIKKIQEFIGTLDPKTLPAFFAIANGKVLAHDFLCDGSEDKRSCTRRVNELMVAAETLDERKPRSPKDKPAET